MRVKVNYILIILGIFLLLVLPTVLAYRTEILVKTKPSELVSINVWDSQTEDSLFNAFERADGTGIYQKNVSTGVKEIDITITSKDNQNVIIGKYEVLGYNAGEPITLDFITKEEPKKQNETETENKTIAENKSKILQETEETETEPTEITGGLISKLKEDFSKIIYYIIGIILLIGILAFFVISKRMGGREINVKKLSEIQKEQKEDNAPTNKEIAEAERKIKEAQQELNKIKNQEKIKVAEKKLEEDKKALEKLKNGE